MKHSAIFSVFALLLTPTFTFGACSVANLTRCLDSACAINIGANPAARCQYCGSAAAGTPTKSTAMKSVSAGSSARYNISDKELKSAPTDPGERYAWATKICLSKVSGCTTEDVNDNYDSLIEQSCTAAGISTQMENLTQKSRKTKNQSECKSEITACVTNEKHCFADYKNCETDADFDKFFADCAVAARGCDSFSKTIRSDLIIARDTTLKNAAKVLETIVASYQKTRENKLRNTQSACVDSAAKNRCIATVCNNNMPHKCDAGYEYENTLAGELCKFYDTACNRLK